MIGCRATGRPNAYVAGRQRAFADNQRDAPAQQRAGWVNEVKHGLAVKKGGKAHALHALSEPDTAFAIEVLRKLPEQVVRENWPYGVIL